MYLDKGGCVYIMANKRNGTIYIGVTSDLYHRVVEHKTHKYKGFTERYDLHLLVWFKSFQTIQGAIAYEKKLKRYKREWKIALIEEMNPMWLDLAERIGPFTRW